MAFTNFRERRIIYRASSLDDDLFLLKDEMEEALRARFIAVKLV